jgi:hypothetical protein
MRFPVKDETLGLWLAQRIKGNTKLTADEIRDALFPSMVISSPDLTAFSIPEAQLQVVQRKAAALDKQKLSLLGIELRTNVAVFLAPSLTLLLNLVFLSYLINIRPITADQNAELATFPWMGLFNDWLSRPILVLSLLAPPGAVVVLLYRLFDSPSHWDLLTRGCLPAIALTIMGSVHETWRLQAEAAKGRMSSLAPEVQIPNNTLVLKPLTSTETQAPRQNSSAPAQ